jgi:arginine N-succinyltransferase
MSFVREFVAADAAVLAGWVNQAGVGVEPALAAGECWLIAADAAGRPQACLRLRERLGLSLPRYSYHVGRAVHAAAELGLFQSQATLLLGNDHTGDSDLADLAHAPDCTEPVAALQALIMAALARIAAQRTRYGERVVVELAGPRDTEGRSPFWQGLGRFFYADDPAAARQRWGEAWTSHLAALLPRQTLYLSFLDDAAQAAVGRVGAAGCHAAAALAGSGFAYGRHVRIDDGGPVWELNLG